MMLKSTSCNITALLNDQCTDSYVSLVDAQYLCIKCIIDMGHLLLLMQIPLSSDVNFTHKLIVNRKFTLQTN